jgi:hypothetical protein
VIYVVQATIGGPVKIGTTTGMSVKSRLAGLQTGCPWPLVVIHTEPGGSREERLLHLRFERHRLHGEWFAVEGDVLEWLRPSIQVLTTVEPVGPPLLGPLSEKYERIMRAIGRDWRSTGDVANDVGLKASQVVPSLRNLRDKRKLAACRYVVIETRQVTQWRSIEASLRSHADSPENYALRSVAA